MPLYPYRCTKCGHRFEKIQKFEDEPETVCPNCGGELERPLTAPGLQFKGAGWYITDYASKGSASSSESNSAPAKSASSESSSTPSAAPAAPAAPAAKPSESKT